MEGIGSGLLIVGFFVPVFSILSILSLPALLMIFFGQPGKSLYLKLLGRLWLLFGLAVVSWNSFTLINPRSVNSTPAASRFNPEIGRAHV